MPSHKAKMAATGSIWIKPLIWNPKNPVAQTFIKVKQSIKSSLDMFYYLYAGFK
jgi:hypothetical protein